MYAIFRTGGKEYKVSPGEVVRVEPLGPGAGFAVAIKCKREIERNLSAFAG